MEPEWAHPRLPACHELRRREIYFTPSQLVLGSRECAQAGSMSFEKRRKWFESSARCVTSELKVPGICVRLSAFAAQGEC